MLLRKLLKLTPSTIERKSESVRHKTAISLAVVNCVSYSGAPVLRTLVEAEACEELAQNSLGCLVRVDPSQEQSRVVLGSGCPTRRERTCWRG